MSTDTAVNCTKLVVTDKRPFSSLDFIDRPEIPVGPNESVIMNFRYIRGPDGDPLMDRGILELIKSEELDTALVE